MRCAKKPILLFETIKVINGESQNLEFHIRRINSVTKPKFDLQSIIKPPSNALLRAKIIYDESGRLRDVGFFEYKIGDFGLLKLIRSNINYEKKYLNRDEINLLVAQKGAANDILIIKNSLITDTSIANVAIMLNDNWYTPKTPLLRGTTRQRLLESGFLKELDFGKEELFCAQKFALMNAMIGFHEVNAKFLV